MKPVSSAEHRRRSSRSGSLVNTPEHQTKPAPVPVGTLFSLGDETGNYLEATNDSSGTNSISSFDALPEVSPPVPPRIFNPPRNAKTASNDHLIIIDTDDNYTEPVPPTPAPAARTKSKMPPPPPTMTSHPSPPPPLKGRMSFENNFVQNTNSLNLQKNIATENKSSNNSRSQSDQSKSSEVRRNPIHFHFNNIYNKFLFHTIWLFDLIIYCFLCVRVMEKQIRLGFFFWFWCQI